MFDLLRASYYQHRRDIRSLILLAIVAIIIFFPMMLRWSSTGDFPVHNGLALKFLENPSETLANVPHFLYHISTAAMYWLTGSHDIGLAGAYLMTLTYIALLWLLYHQIRHASQEQAGLPIQFLAIFLALTLMLLAPINIFTPENIYFGYFAPHVYHNPTVNMTKPFSLLLFFMSLMLFQREKALSRWWIIPFALLTFLSLIAKPSFILAFVPTLGLVCFFYLLRQAKESLVLLLRPLDIVRGFLGVKSNKELPQLLQASFINWAVLLGGIVIPAVLILFYQSLTWTSSGGIGIEPFRLFNEWSIQYDPNANQLLFFKLLMSCAFPLVAYLLHIKESRRDFRFNLAWLFFLVSVAYAYLLVDYTDIDAGDWSWSAQIAIFILNVAAALFLVKHYSERIQSKGFGNYHRSALVLIILVFSLHLISGIHWYQLSLNEDVLELIYKWW